MKKLSKHVIGGFLKMASSANKNMGSVCFCFVKQGWQIINEIW